MFAIDTPTSAGKSNGTIPGLPAKTPPSKSQLSRDNDVYNGAMQRIAKRALALLTILALSGNTLVRSFRPIEKVLLHQLKSLSPVPALVGSLRK